MKKIGGGWQYVVYDMGNDKVYKKYRNKFSRFLFILFHSKTSIFKMWQEVKRMDIEVQNSFRIIQKGKIPLDLLANPVLLGGYDYTQDFCIPLYVVFQNISTEKGKDIIDRFIAFSLKLLDLGVIDLSFRMPTNFGLTKDGDVVLLDIGEIQDDREIIIQQRKARYWQLPYIDASIKDKEVCAYYRKQMDTFFGL